MRYFSMFSGIGGFEVGIEKSYAEAKPQDSPDYSGGTSQYSGRALCVGYSEIDRYASAIYRGHFPAHRNFGDATKIDPRELPGS